MRYYECDMAVGETIKKKLKDPGTYAVLIVLALPIYWLGSLAYPYVNRVLPKDLGPGFEYVGRTDYGCWYPLCGSQPGSSFYFGTDMTIEEVQKYFKKAAPTHTSNVQSSNSGFSNRTLFFRTKSGQDFGITYYDDSKTITKTYHLNPSPKIHIIEIGDEQYWTIYFAL